LAISFFLVAAPVPAPSVDAESLYKNASNHSLTKDKSMPPETPRTIGRDEAETIAVQALGFLAGRPDDLGRFLAVAGLGPANLRRAAADPAFLAGVFAYLLGDEKLLLAFAADVEMPPQRLAAAGRLLGA
jgi:hypothetical protein